MLRFGPFIGLFAGLALYVVVAYSLGVPLFFLFGSPPLMDIGARPLDVVIIPPAPSQIGELITIIVTDGNDQSPVKGVLLTIGSTNGVPPITLETDSNGKAEATYLGVYTYVSASKVGYQPKQSMVPQVSDEIQQARLIAALAGLSVFAALAGPTLAVLFSHWLSQRKQINSETHNPNHKPNGNNDIDP